MSTAGTAAPPGVVTRILDAIETCIKAILAVILVSFTLVVLTDVVCRFALHIPLAWPAELAIVLFQWQVFLGAPVALRQGLHFHVDAFVGLLPPGAHRLVSISVALVVLATACLLIGIGWQLAVRTAGSMYITMPLSHSVLYVSIIAGGILTALFAIERIVVDLFRPSASRPS